MPIGTSKIGVLGAGTVPGGCQTFNAPGTFSVPPGVTRVNITGKGSTGNPGNPGNAGNSGNFAIGGAGGGGGGVDRTNPGPGPTRGGQGGSTFNGPVVNTANPRTRGGGGPGCASTSPPYTGSTGATGNSGNAGTAGTAGSAGNPGNSSSTLCKTFPGGAGGNAGAAGNAGTGGSGGTGGGGAPGQNGPSSSGTPGGSGGNAGGSGGSARNNPNPQDSFRFQGGGGGGGAGVTNSGACGQPGCTSPDSPLPVQFAQVVAGGNTSNFNISGSLNCKGVPTPFYRSSGSWNTNITGGSGGAACNGNGVPGGNVFCTARTPCICPGPAQPLGRYRMNGPPPANQNQISCLQNGITANNIGLRSGAGGGGGGGIFGNPCLPYRGAGGGGGGGRGNDGNAGGSGGTGGTAAAATPTTFNCVSVTPGGSVPVTVASPGGQIVISWNPQ